MIIFSHGHQNNAINCVYTLEALASAGFIVAAPDHLNGTQDDIRIDFINSQAHLEVIPCFDGRPFPFPCAHRDVMMPDGTLDVSESMTDRAYDIRAVLDALPTWFGDRVDLSRVGVMGHSRGTVSALVAAGGSDKWHLQPDPRVKAIMGLAIGVHDITFGANLEGVTVPTLLVAGTLDSTEPVSLDAFDKLASTDKSIVVMPNVNHRHFDSGLCAQTQSSGAIASVNPRAVLDLQTLRGLVTGAVGRVAMDFCGVETFTDPSDIQPLVSSLTGFDFASRNVPTTGVDSSMVRREVSRRAVAFFRSVLPQN